VVVEKSSSRAKFLARYREDQQESMNCPRPQGREFIPAGSFFDRPPAEAEENAATLKT
jgi:hypothetical protein